MNILFQSLVRNTNPLSSSILIRYLERKENRRENPVDQKEIQLASMDGAIRKKTSYIIIRKEYAYLEAVVRETFQNAADIQVLIDRRCKDRRTSCSANGGIAENRRKLADRRVSSPTPILDILINLNDPKSK